MPIRIYVFADIPHTRRSAYHAPGIIPLKKDSPQEAQPA